SSGWNMIVKNKNKVNHMITKRILNNWLNKNFAFYRYLQLHYKDIKPKIIAEKYIQDFRRQLNDYKLCCIDVEVYFCWVFVEDDNERYGNIYDLNWKLQPWRFKNRNNTPYKVKKPENFDTMIEIAKKLSKDFSHVRVDLYNVDGKIYFGEMTFTSSGGYHLIIPEEYNYKLGELWKIESEKPYIVNNKSIIN